MSEPAGSIVLASGAVTEAGEWGGPDHNEDAVYAGRHLFAVADGYSGFDDVRLGGVASATVIDTLKPLDTQPPAGDLTTELARHITEANTTLGRLNAEHSSTAGAVLTAMLWSGHDLRLALAHIGDSRAYLLRDQELFQITYDHILPHTSPPRLVRCLDGGADRVPDLSMRQACFGDRYLLCTSGLGPTRAQTIHDVVSTIDDPTTAATELLTRAKAQAQATGGGTDIGCVIIDVRREQG